MNLRIDSEIALMEMMTIGELRNKYAEVFGEVTESGNKLWMVKRIAWRIQANAQGGLSPRARQRAEELANDADLRLTAPRPPKTAPVTAPVEAETSDELMTGRILKRIYKDRAIIVKVIDGGFEYEGERYKSLTAVAKKVTGKHWNGFHFFKLRQRAEA
jgi:hypothetical protein